MTTYSFSPDSVLIHPALPAIRITAPPKGLRINPDAALSWVVAGRVAPINWQMVCSWYGVTQIRRNQLWPMRALLHAYLLCALHHVVRPSDSPRYREMVADMTGSYESWLERPEAPVFTDFWHHMPRMILLAMTALRENHIVTVINALLATIDPTRTEMLLDQFRVLREEMAREHSPQLEGLLITKRRRGIIDRALFRAIASKGSLMATDPAAKLPRKFMRAEQDVAARTQMLALKNLLDGTQAHTTFARPTTFAAPAANPFAGVAVPPADVIPSTP